MRRTVASLLPLLARRRGAIARLAAWIGVLTAATAAHGLLAGPVLRLVFGGAPTLPGAFGSLAPPAWLAAWLPGLVVLAALVKALATHRHALAVGRLGQSVVAELRSASHAAVLRMS